MERGECRVRVNRGGKLRTLVYGKPCSLHVDPVEKKPMFHFLPGSPIFSIATAGCNLSCLFCQNWSISQSDPEDLENHDYPPERVIEAARRSGCESIAYTYTDPVIYFEYALDTARLARKAGMKNVLVTAAYIEEEPLRELCEVTDGANVDLKSFDDNYYREICNGRLKPVLRSLEIMHEAGVLVEITNLVVPTLNDDPGMIAEMCVWIRDTLGAETPLHFSRFHPRHRLANLPPTSKETLILAAETALGAGLKHVYVGNLRDRRFEHTYCPACGKAVIRRAGFRILERNMKNGACAHCGRALRGVWRKE